MRRDQPPGDPAFTAGGVKTFVELDAGAGVGSGCPERRNAKPTDRAGQQPAAAQPFAHLPRTVTRGRLGPGLVGIAIRVHFPSPWGKAYR